MKAKLLIGLALVLSSYCHAAIIHPQAPKGGRQLVDNFLHQDSLEFLGVSNSEELTILAPWQSYSVGLTNLAAGKLLSAANPGKGGGWQYLLVRGTNAVGLLWLKADARTGKALKCTELDSCDNARMKALRVAEQLPQVQKSDYELRSLDMPWIPFHVLWLHGKTDDIIIPLQDCAGSWQAYQPCSEEKMIQVLKPMAQKLGVPN